MRAKSDKACHKGGWIHRLTEAREFVQMPVATRQKQHQAATIDWTAKAREMALSNSAADARKNLAHGLGVTLDSLESLSVGRGCDLDWFCSFPMRDGAGRVTGIVRRYADGRKKTMQGSRAGLFYSPDWWVGPGPVFLPEGGSDTAAAIGMNLNAVGRPSNRGCVKSLAALLRSRRAVVQPKGVVVIGENDEAPARRGKLPACPSGCKGCGVCWPGLSGAIDTATDLARALGWQVGWCLPPAGAKDLRSWALANPFGAIGFDCGKAWRDSITVNWI